MAAQFLESTGAELPARRLHQDPYSQNQYGISAFSRTPRSFMTAIRADIGEDQAYKQALLRGEIGLQRPFGANVPGVDFITAVRDGASGIKEVLCTDVKTSGRGRFPAPKKTIPGTWLSEVQGAVSASRLKLKVSVADAASAAGSFPMPHTPAEVAALEQKIRDAVSQNRVRLRQLNANYSPAGQGNITGW